MLLLLQILLLLKKKYCSDYCRYYYIITTTAVFESQLYIILSYEWEWDGQRGESELDSRNWGLRNNQTNKSSSFL